MWRHVVDIYWLDPTVVARKKWKSVLTRKLTIGWTFLIGFFFLYRTDWIACSRRAGSTYPPLMSASCTFSKNLRTETLQGVTLFYRILCRRIQFLVSIIDEKLSIKSNFTPKLFDNSFERKGVKTSPKTINILINYFDKTFFLNRIQV